MLKYRVSARRIDSHGSEATTKDARIVLDTDMAGGADAFNPVWPAQPHAFLKGAKRGIQTVASAFGGRRTIIPLRYGKRFPQTKSQTNSFF